MTETLLCNAALAAKRCLYSNMSRQQHAALACQLVIEEFSLFSDSTRLFPVLHKGYNRVWTTMKSKEENEEQLRKIDVLTTTAIFAAICCFLQIFFYSCVHRDMF